MSSFISLVTKTFHSLLLANVNYAIINSLVWANDVNLLFLLATINYVNLYYS